MKGENQTVSQETRARGVVDVCASLTDVEVHKVNMYEREVERGSREKGEMNDVHLDKGYRAAFWSSENGDYAFGNVRPSSSSRRKNRVK